MKKRTFLMACILLISLFTACTNQEAPSGNPPAASPNGAAPTSGALTAEAPPSGTYYELRSAAAPADTMSVLSHGEQFYYLISDYEKFSLQNADGEALYEADGVVLCSTACEDGIWLCEMTRENGVNGLILRLVSYAGESVRTVDPGAVYETEWFARGLRCSSGMLFLFCIDELVVLRESGELVCAAPLPENLGSVALGSDGEVYIAESTEAGNDIYTVDIPSSTLTLRFSTEKGRIFDGQAANTDYLFILEAQTGLYGIGAEGEATPLVIWSESRVSVRNLRHVLPLAEGGFFCMIDGQAYTLVPVDYSQVGAKARLTLAMIGEGWSMPGSVARFNSQSGDYYVEIIDYTDGGALTEEQAVIRLSTEIITGNLPDIICFTSLSPFPFISKGYLSDMRAYLQKDADISESDIAISGALEMSGGLYLMSGSFSYETKCARYSDFGDRYGWTLSEYLELERSRPAGAETIYNTTRERFLRCLSSRYLSTAIDWTNASCDFDNPEFIEILEAASRIRENPEDINDMNFTRGAVRVAQGSLVASAVWGDSVWKLSHEEQMAGQELSFIGWPTVDGSCGSDLYIDAPLGIAAQSPNADGCWEYIKFLLMDSAERTPYLPVYKPALESMLEAAKADETIPVRFSDADKEQFYGLLSAIESVSIYDETVLKIIAEEGEALFAGIKSAAEVARIIQSRVSIYVAEQS